MWCEERVNMEKIVINNLKEKINFLIDDADYEEVKNWDMHFDRYVSISKKDGPFLFKASLHRYLMKCPKEFVVDHINGNKYDNRRINLRVVKHQENARNRRKSKLIKNKKPSSKYLGVTYSKSNKKWQASVHRVYLGKYDTEIDAAIAYDTFIKHSNNEFNNLNFPNGKKEIFYKRKSNKRKFHGVIQHKNKWKVSFMYKGKIYNSKMFLSEIEAAMEYNNIVKLNNFAKPLNIVTL